MKLNMDIYDIIVKLCLRTLPYEDRKSMLPPLIDSRIIYQQWGRSRNWLHSRMTDPHLPLFSSIYSKGNVFLQSRTLQKIIRKTGEKIVWMNTQNIITCEPKGNYHNHCDDKVHSKCCPHLPLQSLKPCFILGNTPLATVPILEWSGVVEIFQYVNNLIDFESFVSKIFWGDIFYKI